jgi:hypothetical protein
MDTCRQKKNVYVRGVLGGWRLLEFVWTHLEFVLVFGLSVRVSVSL